MKKILAAIVIILVLGLIGFFYRNLAERVTVNPNDGTASEACTADAKICPDGSAVGRTGPGCSFVACPAPNVELPLASSTLAFVLPAGYTQLEQGASGQTTLRIYQKPTATADVYDVLTVSAFPIAPGQTANDLMLANTIYDPSGMTATSTNSFKTLIEGSNTFYVAKISQFEGQVETAYYLPTANDLFRFDIIERNVASTTDPKLDTQALPEHQAVQQMLSTVQISGS